MRNAATAGFTLIEMLVVITIIGLMIGGAVLALGVVGRDRSLENEANRLRAVLDYARDRAELETRHYGLRVTREGYAFAWFDPRTGLWQPAIDDALRTRRLAASPIRRTRPSRRRLPKTRTIVLLLRRNSESTRVVSSPPSSWCCAAIRNPMCSAFDRI